VRQERLPRCGVTRRADGGLGGASRSGCLGGRTSTRVREIDDWRGAAAAADHPQRHWVGGDLAAGADGTAVRAGHAGGQEGRVSLHARRDRVAEIVALAKQEHPYEVPGISMRTITDGNPDYLAWITSETAPDHSLASFGRKPCGRGGCRARLPRHQPQPVPAVTSPDAARRELVLAVSLAPGAPSAGRRSQRTGPERRALSGSAPPASTVLRIRAPRGKAAKLRDVWSCQG